MCLCVNSVDQFTKATLQKAGTCNCYVIKYQMELHLSWENNRCLLEWSATTTHDVKERLHTNTQRDRDGWIHLKLINAILVRSVNIKNIVDLLFFSSSRGSYVTMMTDIRIHIQFFYAQFRFSSYHFVAWNWNTKSHFHFVDTFFLVIVLFVKLETAKRTEWKEIFTK